MMRFFKEEGQVDEGATLVAVSALILRVGAHEGIAGRT